MSSPRHSLVTSPRDGITGLQRFLRGAGRERIRSDLGVSNANAVGVHIVCDGGYRGGDPAQRPAGVPTRRPANERTASGGEPKSWTVRQDCPGRGSIRGKEARQQSKIITLWVCGPRVVRLGDQIPRPMTQKDGQRLPRGARVREAVHFHLGGLAHRPIAVPSPQETLNGLPDARCRPWMGS